MNYNILIFIIILLVTFSILWKNRLELMSSVFFTVFFIITIWINIPCFVSGDIIVSQNALISYPYQLMDQFGIAYTVLANIVLSILLFALAKNTDNGKYSYKGVKRQYDDFVGDASELYIIGKDLDFLGKVNFSLQTNRIVHLGRKCKLLCEHTKDKELINLYKKIQKDGVQIRFYNEAYDFTNLKGQIKIDQNGNKKALFVTRLNKKYMMMKIDNQFLVESILIHYRNAFDKSISPN